MLFYQVVPVSRKESCTTEFEPCHTKGHTGFTVDTLKENYFIVYNHKLWDQRNLYPCIAKQLAIVWTTKHLPIMMQVQD